MKDDKVKPLTKMLPVSKDPAVGLEAVKAVDPNGKVRTLRHQRNVCNPHLDVLWDDSDPQCPKVVSVKIAKESAAEGWRLAD